MKKLLLNSRLILVLVFGFGIGEVCDRAFESDLAGLLAALGFIFNYFLYAWLRVEALKEGIES